MIFMKTLIKNDNALQDAQKFAELCKQELGENLASVVLFGSAARGTSGKWSDMDFCVIMKKRYDDKKEFGLKMRLREAFGRHADIIFREEKEIPQQIAANSAIDFEIMSDGTPVYGAQYFLKYKPLLKDAIKQNNLSRKQELGKGVWVYGRLRKHKAEKGAGSAA